MRAKVILVGFLVLALPRLLQAETMIPSEGRGVKAETPPIYSEYFDRRVILWGVNPDRAMLRPDTEVTQGSRLLPTTVAQNSEFDPTDRVGIDLTGEPPRTELAVQSGHVVNIIALQFSPDGQLLATAGADEIIKLWDVTMGREVRTLVGSRGPVYTLRFSADGRLLASGGWDRFVRLWDVNTGTMLTELGEHKQTVQSVAFSPTEEMLAVGTFDYDKDGEAVVIWDLRAIKEAHRLPVAGIVHALDYSPDGQFLAVGDGTQARVILFHARDWSITRQVTWKPPPSLSGSTDDRDPIGDRVYSLAWSADGHSIAAVSRGQAVLINPLDDTSPKPIPSQYSIRRALFQKNGSL